MAREYLEQLSALMGQIEGEKFSGVDIECKHFFSGAAAYANGRIFISLTPVGLALKLPPSSRKALLQKKGARPLRYFPKGPIKKEYVLLPVRMHRNMKDLQHWISISIAQVLTLPASTKAKMK